MHVSSEVLFSVVKIIRENTFILLEIQAKILNRFFQTVFFYKYFISIPYMLITDNTFNNCQHDVIGILNL